MSLRARSSLLSGSMPLLIVHSHPCSSVEQGRDRIGKEQAALKDLAAQEVQMKKQITLAQESLNRLTKQMVCQSIMI